MPALVALDLPAGPAFVRAVQQAWDAGDAVAPIDQRLAPAARERTMAMLKPSRVVTPVGTARLDASVEVASGDALVMTTSGSTGEPKGVVLTHAGVAASALASSSRLGVVPGHHRWLACLPLSHIGGFAVVARALLTGTALSVLPGFNVADVEAAGGPEVLVSLVPTALARTGAWHFYKVVLGGSPPPYGLAPNVVTTYGMTETGSGVVYDGVPLDGVEVAIGVGGEIRLRGPMLLRCYRDGTCPIDDDGWLPTGDAGSITAAGRLSVHGRLSDMVITGGENVWPMAVEQILATHPGVAEVAVSSRADPEWGELVVACVVPVDPAEPPRLEAMRGLVKEALAAYAAPRELILMDALPKTSIGKVRRDELRRLVAALAAGH